MKKICKKLTILILGILVMQSCTFVRSPKDYPLIVTGIRQSDEPEYTIYTIKDSNPKVDGWGEAAMYLELKDKRNKFNVGDTVVLSKK